MNDTEKVDLIKLCDTMIERNKKELKKAQIREDVIDESYRLGSLSALEAVTGELKK